MSTLPTPLKGAMIYEDKTVYVCLANFPLTKGHTVVVWKEAVTDLHLLGRSDYEHLMDIVDQTRNAMMTALSLEKVYLMYMDEINHVHWHLVPRYDESGINALTHSPKKLDDTSLAEVIKNAWVELN